MPIIQLYHPTDPRWLIVDELPREISPDDVYERKYGKPLVFQPGTVDAEYFQPLGFGTNWVRP